MDYVGMQVVADGELLLVIYVGAVVIDGGVIDVEKQVDIAVPMANVGVQQV